jgi:hypothetical protein
MTAIINIYNKAGSKVGESIGQCDRTWVLSGYGQTSIDMSFLDTYCLKDIIKFGNYVIISADTDKIPLWAGTIETPRNWSANGITIKCYSIEWSIKKRIGPKNLKKTGTCSELLKYILDYANNQGNTRIAMGDFYGGGSNMTETLNFTPLYDDIDRIVKRSGFDWGVDPVIDSHGKLSFTMNLYEHRGNLYESLQLLEGKTIELVDVPLTEDGDIWNDVTGYGEGSTWDSRISYNSKNQDSINKYGLRQHGKEFSGNKNLSTLKKNVSAFLAKYSEPRIKFVVNVVDDNDIFYYMRLGNSFPIKLHSFGFGKTEKFGFSGIVKIFGMGYNDEDNKFMIVTEAQDETGE